MAIPELGLVMDVPPGLTHVSYTLRGSNLTLDDQAGVAHAALNQMVIYTAECANGGSVNVTLWDTDPAKLIGEGYGGDISGQDTRVGGRYLHIEGGDRYPASSCSPDAAARLQQLVASASAAPP